MEIMQSNWYVDNSGDLFYLKIVDGKKYRGEYLDRSRGIWFKEEIIREATKEEVDSITFTLKQ